MDKFESEATKNLELQIKELRAELKREISKLIEGALSSLVASTLAQFNLAGEVAVITWDFEEDSDDEGGTVWYPYNIRLEIDGNGIDLEELEPVKRKSRWAHSNQMYDYYLEEDLNDIINSFKGQLIDLGIDEQLTITIGGQN